MPAPRTRLRASVLAAAAAICWAAVIAPAASADHPPAPTAGQGLTEPQLRALETELLGAEHAAEHARERAADAEPAPAAAADSLTPAQRAAANGPESQVGAWTQAPFEIPAYAIHSVQLPTGKILFWGYPPRENGIRPNGGEAAVWDPTLGTGPEAFHEVPPPTIDPDGPGPQGSVAAPIYCTGMSLLADGTVLAAGGNLVWPDAYGGDGYSDYVGMERVFTFDPVTETWTEQPRMAGGRWYPSQVLLPDGRTVILGGYTEQAPGGIDSSLLEVFVPDDDDPDSLGEVVQVPGAARSTALYPHLFTLPDGNVLLAGPAQGDSAVLAADRPLDSWHWTSLRSPSRNRIGGSAVLRPQGPEGSYAATQIGGYDPNEQDAAGNVGAVASTETMDASQPEPEWRPDAALTVPRSYHNTVLLPDASLVTIGGGTGRSQREGTYAVGPDQRHVELLPPAGGDWILGPAQREDRGYHSTALLLPDGRVWSAGDDRHPVAEDGTDSQTDTAELYSPPYLFQGPRPLIKRAPQQLGWHDSFGIRTRKGETAVLVAPGATTHGADMHQRLVPLKPKSRVRRTGINVASPPSPAVAPPGYYMLFVLRDGVPSVARWVLLTDAAKNAPRIPRRRR